VADPIPCPTCQALLRIPAGAAAVRCPNCKTVLPNPAASVAAPPPLPFGRAPAAPPAPAMPSGKLPAAKPAPLPQAKPAPLPRAKAGPPPVPVVAAVETDEAKKQKMRKELKKLEREEERAEERYEELTEQCRNGRTAATILSWAVRGYALGVLLVVVGVGAAAFGPAGTGALYCFVALAAGGVTVLAMLAGFGFALAGPVAGRHLGVIGLVVVLLHAGLVGIQFVRGFADLARATPDGDKYSWVEMGRFLDLFGPVTDLTLLSEQPARVLKQYPLSVFGILGAALEFTRLVILCLLAQNYAAAGREREVGHASMETVSRVFWAVLLAAMFRVSFAFLFDHAAPEDLWAKVGLGAHGALTLFTLLAIGLFLFKQSQILEDTAEACDPRRYSLDAERYEA
jgi:LSD1 subclass zinc finger protein